LKAKSRGVELRARAITVRIGSREVLREVSLRARPGRLLVVTGPAGSGKTTLLHVLAGIIEPNEGEVTIDGMALEGYGRNKSATLGFVPQTFGLAAALSVAENMAVPLQLARLAREEVGDRVAKMLAALGLDNAAGQLATELSGGQRQRAAVGRAIVAEPDLVIADEPTSELDAASRDVVFSLLRAAGEAGSTVVLATHDPELVSRCDDTVLLHDGRGGEPLS
jgi:putative ABC transport system ATP-binding protein